MSSYRGKTIYVKKGDWVIAHPTICFSYNDQNRFHGIFYKESNIFKYTFPVLMVHIIMVFSLSRLIYFLLRPLKQPKIVSNVLAGIILGPSVLGRSKVFRETFFAPKELQVLNTFVAFGVAYYIFLSAVKKDAAALLKNAKKAWSISLLTYIFPITMLQFFGSSLDKYLVNCYRVMVSFFSNAGLNTSHFPVIVNILEEQDILATELGQLALTIAMLLELFYFILTQIFISMLVIGFTKKYMSGLETFIITFAVFFFAIWVVRPLVLQIIKRKPDGEPIRDVYVIAIILCALFGAVMADMSLGITLPGALLIGLAIPDGPPLGSIILEKSELVVSEIFLPLFYVQIGFNIELSSITDLKAFYVFVLRLVILNFSKILATMLASSFFKIKLKNAFLLGCILNFKGVHDLFLYHRWFQDTNLSAQCFTTIAVFSLVSNFIFCPLVQLLYKPEVRLKKSVAIDEAFILQTLQSTPDDFDLRVLSCLYSEDNVPSMITILNGMRVDRTKPMRLYFTHLVELLGRASPMLIACKNNNKSTISNESNRIIRAFKNFASESQGSISYVQPFIAIAPIKSMHEIICKLAQDKHIPFIIVPFNYGSEKAKWIQHSIRKFNSMLQQRAHCTIGILIDRGLNLRNSLLFIAVLFVGGPDDREALALATRMSGNPQVKITMFRIIYKENGEVCECEKELDEYSVQEFKKESKIRNGCVSFSEMVANNGKQMIEVIRSLRKNYNLIIAGKNPRRSKYEEEMVTWIDHQELGVIGDAIASADFDGAGLSALVIKHSNLSSGEFR